MSGDEHAKLAKSIADLDKKIVRQGITFSRKIAKFEEKLMEKLEPLFQDFTGRNYVAKNKANSSINIDPRFFDVIKWLAAAVLIALGGKEVIG